MVTTVDGEGQDQRCVVRHLRVRVCPRSSVYRFYRGRRRTPAITFPATGEFVVNVPPFEREILEKVRVVGLEFPPRVNELEKAGLTALAAKTSEAAAHRGVPQPFRVQSRMDQAVATPSDGCR